MDSGSAKKGLGTKSVFVSMQFALHGRRLHQPKSGPQRDQAEKQVGIGAPSAALEEGRDSYAVSQSACVLLQ
jgi:hypothetical protein